MGELGLSDQQFSVKFLVPEMEMEREMVLLQIEAHSDCAHEVVGNEKHPCEGSIEQEDGLLLSDYKNGKIVASSMAGDVGSPYRISPSADETLGDRKVKDIIDDVDNFIKSSFANGNYREFVDQFKTGEGVWADNLRAVVRAKIAKRRRGQSDNLEHLCEYPSLAGGGLSYKETHKLQCYVYDYMRHVWDFKAWSEKIRMKGVVGAYLRARLRAPKRASFYDYLKEMTKEGISLEALAIVVTEISCSEFIQQLSG